MVYGIAKFLKPTEPTCRHVRWISIFLASCCVKPNSLGILICVKSFIIAKSDTMENCELHSDVSFIDLIRLYLARQIGLSAKDLAYLIRIKILK